MRVPYERLLGRQGYRLGRAGPTRDGSGDGLDVARTARTSPVPPPAIVVTRSASAGSGQAAVDAGAVAFIVKPFTAAGLTRAVSVVLGSRRQ